MDDESPWLEENTDTIAQQEWSKLSTKYSDVSLLRIFAPVYLLTMIIYSYMARQAGYRDGITSGKQSTLQIGFDQGFSIAAPIARRIGGLRAVANGLLSLFTTTAGGKHSGFLDRTIESSSVDMDTTDPSTSQQGLNEQDKTHIIAELRQLVLILAKLQESTTLPPDLEAKAHAKTHEEGSTEGMSLERVEKREMDEIEGLLGGVGVGNGSKEEVVQEEGEVVVRRCEQRLEELLRRCGLGGTTRK